MRTWLLKILVVGGALCVALGGLAQARLVKKTKPYVDVSTRGARIGNGLLRLMASPDPRRAVVMARAASIPTRKSTSGRERVAVILEPRARQMAPVFGPAINEKLVEALGGEIDAVSRSLMRVYVPVDGIERLAGHPDVALIRAPSVAIPVGFGNTEAESVPMTGAEAMHAAGITGAGVRVAVLDGGFSTLDDAIAAGELPADAVPIDFTGDGYEGTSSHGVLVAEHVMDMAPDVHLTLIRVRDVVDLENAADYIRDNGITVVNMSLAWPGRSYYDGTGPVSDVFNELYDLNDVFIAVASGNYARQHWRGGWNDDGGDDYLDFSPGDSYMRLSARSWVRIYAELNWNQYGNSVTDLDLELVAKNADGSYTTVASARGAQTGSQNPREWLAYEAQDGVEYNIRVARYSGPTEPDLDVTLFVFDTDIEYPMPEHSLTDPGAAHGVFTVGVINRGDWEAADPPLESFSSEGPTNDGRLKPDIASMDGTSSWSRGPFGSMGTSVASPILAGAAALLRAEDPTLTNAEIADRIRNRAIDTGAPGPDSSYGYGRFQLILGNAPVAVDDAPTTDEDTAVDIDVLANDFDSDGDVITLVEVGEAAHGQLVVMGDDADPTVTYMPDADFNGEDSFTYTIEDPLGLSDTATVLITVGAMPDAPRPAADRVSTPPSTAIVIDVLANDLEPDGEPLAVVEVTDPAHGAAVDNGDGTISYTPEPGFQGLDIFQYTVTDGQGTFAAADVEVWVSADNAAPVAVDDQAATLEDTAVDIDVLVNDYDYEGDELLIDEIVQSPDGVAELTGPTTIRFSPRAHFHGPVSFSYRIQDGQGGSDTADVQVAVASVNDPPDAADDEGTTGRNDPVVIDVLANDADVDGDPIEIASVQDSSDGTVEDNGDGTITFTPTTGFVGDATVFYTLRDIHGDTDTATVSISVLMQPGLDWLAYNDLNVRSGGSTNSPSVTQHDYTASNRSLRSYDTGALLEVRMSGVTQGGFDPTTNGVAMAAGTDAAETFAGFVDQLGVDELDGADWRSTVVFNGLDPAKSYTISLSANRGDPRYANQRFSRVTLEGADSFTNASTPGVIVYGEDSVSFSRGDNTQAGYVARWTDIRAVDGTFSVVSAWDDAQGAGGGNTKGYAMAYFRLEQWTLEAEICQGAADCDDGNLCTDDVCDLQTGLCSNPFNAAPCDDGMGCTINDTCTEGLCGGVASDEMCDDGNVCTYERCDLERGCLIYSNNGEACDDGVACTRDDLCHDRMCTGVDDCIDSEVCDLDGGQCMPALRDVVFSAFNDLAWGDGQRLGNITRFTSPAGGSGLPTAGELLDFDTGAGTGVTLNIEGGTYNGAGHAGDGRNAPIGTDAGDLFGAAVDTLGTISYIDVPGAALVLTFSGLDPSALYRLVYHCDRADYSWDRDSYVTLMGADAFRNTSSDADDNPNWMLGGRLYHGPMSASTRLPADNLNGYVARFTDIEPGADGELVLDISVLLSDGERGKYGSAVLLQEIRAGCGVDADCEDGNPCTDDACDLGRCVITANTAVCDDDVGCTTDDVCIDGQCVGTPSCPPGETCDVDSGACLPDPQCAVDADCDDGNMCTDDMCDGATAQCINVFNQAPCDDGVACTEGDQCRDGACEPGAPQPGDCDDNEVCTDDACDVDLGCLNVPHARPCDDGVACTTADQCSNGTCVGGVPDSGLCDDNNVCTDDTCDAQNGCTFVDNADPCDDGVACTDNDLCTGGACAGQDACLEGSVCDVDAEVCRPIEPGVIFRAYNDLAWADGQPMDNITRMTAPGTSLPSTGELLDHETGAGTGVTLTVAGGRYDPGLNGWDGRSTEPGTDADDLFGFGGVIDTRGAIAYVNAPNSPLVLTFGGLDLDGSYNLVFYGDRGAYGWDRASRVTLSGADAFVNESSVAQDNPAPGSGGALFSGPDDPTTRLPADNSSGYVARFTEIVPGPEGEIVLIITEDGSSGPRGKYANAVRLEQIVSDCRADADCDDGNVCTDDTCDLLSGVCTSAANQAACDDGFLCTIDDQCQDGTCAGTPDDLRCDDANVCTDDICAAGVGCAPVPNTDPCDDGASCTADDVCTEGACAGDDICVDGLVCDVGADECRPDDPGPEPQGFRAFNDLAWAEGQGQDNITRFSAAGSSLPSTGELIDHETGEATGVRLTVTGGRYDMNLNGGDGREAALGTDAGDLLGHAVDTRGAIAYVSAADSNLVLTFSDLDPQTTYGIVFHGDRGRYGWDRASRVTLTGAGAFTNESSQADDNPASGSGGALFGGPEDASTRLPADNPNGYVARFTHVDPGADGEIALVVSPDGTAGYRGKYANAVMIEEVATRCEIDADCDDGNVCTDDACDVQSGQCIGTPNLADCDDGLACTTRDECRDGVCHGADPDDGLCADGNECTDDICNPAVGCEQIANAGPCDDGAACTLDDVCAGGSCVGRDNCPEGESCDVGGDQCVSGGDTFRAYNDLAWGSGQLDANITRLSAPEGGSGMASTGELVDYETGAGTGVVLSVSGGVFNGAGHAYDGRDAPVGTDAEAIFGHIVSTRGAVAYVNAPESPLVLTFDGLSPHVAYAVAFHGDRGAYGWDRASRVTIDGADAFINGSSVAQDNPAVDSGGALFAGPDDSSTRLPADNPSGYVARFTDVVAGADGRIVLTIDVDGSSGWRGKYGSAVMIEGSRAGCQVDADCDDGNECTDNTCDGNACQTLPIEDPCDDGVDCTTDDVCADGVCAGIDGCAEGAACDHETGQCLAGPDWDWVAYNDFYDQGGGASNTTGYAYDANAGALVDYASGDPLPVTMTGSIVSGYDPKQSGVDAGHGTDADATFGGIVSLAGSFELDAARWQNVVTFDNLNPDKRYTIALTANRGNGGYAGARFTRVTITGANTFSNAGTEGVILNGPDSVSFSTGFNAGGLVARWTDVTADDGSFSIISEWDNLQGGGPSNTKGYAMSVFKLVQMDMP